MPWHSNEAIAEIAYTYARGASIFKMADQSRHRSMDTLQASFATPRSSRILERFVREYRGCKRSRLYEHGCVTEMDIVQLVYRPAEPQGASKDYDFSRSSMQRLWQQGASAVETVLRASQWLAPKPKELGVRVFDVP
jgi:hypothetical protein